MEKGGHIPNFHKIDKKCVLNYCPITVTSVIKLFEKIIRDKVVLFLKLDIQLREYRNEFRSNM